MRYVRFPRRKTWHIVGRTYGTDTLTSCDRKIPADARWVEEGTLEDGEVCWSCLSGQEWRDYSANPEDRMTLQQYITWYRAVHGPAPVSQPLPHALEKRCMHHWEPTAFDPTILKCAWCGRLQKGR